MKKHLIAAAVAAAVAVPAAAQVTVYGVLDHAYTDTSVNALASDAVTKTKNSGADGQLSGSRLGFRGTEDLGGGLKAGFVVELGINATEKANGIENGTRLGFVEVSGGFGAVRVGRQVSATKALNDSYTAFANSTFNAGNVVGGTATNDTTNQLITANAGDRVGNAITYMSPSVSGFSVMLQHSKSSAADASGEDTVAAVAPTATASMVTANPTQTGFGLTYTAGPLSIMVAQQGIKTVLDGATTSEDEHNALGASYSLGATKLFLAHNTRETKASSVVEYDREDTTVGVSYPMGQITLLAAYSTGEIDKKSATAGVYDLSGMQIGAVYNFSKRTNVYAVYGDNESKTKTGGTAGQTAKRDGFGLGVRHSF